MNVVNLDTSTTQFLGLDDYIIEATDATVATEPEEKDEEGEDDEEGSSASGSGMATDPIDSSSTFVSIDIATLLFFCAAAGFLMNYS